MNKLLTEREKLILNYLLGIRNKITTQELAKEFDISVRTVKYNLANIKEWLGERNIELFSKRGQGIWLELLDSQKLILKNELVDNLETIAISQEKRINHIMFELISATQAVSSESIANKLQLAQNTILNDIKKIELLLEQFNLTLVRVSGKGFSVEGTEHTKRFVSEMIVQKELSEFDIYRIMTELIKKNDINLLNGFFNINTSYQRIFLVAIDCLSKAMKQSDNQTLDYSELLSLTIRGSVSMFRLLTLNPIGTYKIISNSKKKNISKEVAYNFVHEMVDYLELPLLQDEYDYIKSDYHKESLSYNFHQLTEGLIDGVEKELQFPFSHDQLLFNNLMAHLALRFSKNNLYVNEYNPFVEDIKEEYTEVYKAVLHVTNKLIKDYAIIINDSFVSFLSLHFIASLERYKQRKKIKIVYVCSTGVGVTSLLQQKVEEEIANVEVVSFASVLNIQEEIENKTPDLIISIFTLKDVQIPWIKVNPIPSKKDIRNIQEMVNEILDNQIETKQYDEINIVSDFSGFEQSDEISRDLIVKGYLVYQELKEAIGDELIEGYEDAFLLHVLLLVHRITFDTQYMTQSNTDQELFTSKKATIIKIEKVFSEQELPINLSEIIAILQYVA
ncbi:BglG family transcription antiterminator [Vagococcus xieshaowenii]|uniref:Transcription antiterminator n=1 Tax=Vagococcus xieshaowenii TaxID=2562451 RepID=A0A4Z0D1C6_9ENTE|nr:PRD domain-containing protein [Vagococcus xieshaowenii]QCA29400.1 transcription antiterminator [Vagococcus xieshaowenii]TFZ39307.1 transcription antiterminator [Vagococcus xieshaowenii]